MLVPRHASNRQDRGKLASRWDSSGGIAPEQVNSIELDEAEKLIDQLLAQSQGHISSHIYRACHFEII